MIKVRELQEIRATLERASDEIYKLQARLDMPARDLYNKDRTRSSAYGPTKNWNQLLESEKDYWRQLVETQAQFKEFFGL